MLAAMTLGMLTVWARPELSGVAQVLAAFAQTARNEVALEALGDEMVGVVEDTVQPVHVSLWLGENSDRL